jgi:putative SOS response-associated peptidase YedK
VRSGRAWTSHSGAEPSIRSKGRTGRTGRWKDNRFRLDIKTGSKQINAPSESILDKPSFRKTAVKRRELVPAEGYYEWQKTEDG